ncbi:hypothetical protein TWF696_004643 [Orbilia brochopaga]|uniref:Uncharacterized protein n=1 Tax=Orbilia brochopaga TaxID=3140254 RepID=A0AAV9V7I9_9PEZI
MATGNIHPRRSCDSGTTLYPHTPHDNDEYGTSAPVKMYQPYVEDADDDDTPASSTSAVFGDTDTPAPHPDLAWGNTHVHQQQEVYKPPDPRRRVESQLPGIPLRRMDTHRVQNSKPVKPDYTDPRVNRFLPPLPTTFWCRGHTQLAAKYRDERQTADYNNGHSQETEYHPRPMPMNTTNLGRGRSRGMATGGVDYRYGEDVYDRRSPTADLNTTTQPAAKHDENIPSSIPTGTTKPEDKTHHPPTNTAEDNQQAEPIQPRQDIEHPGLIGRIRRAIHIPVSTPAERAAKEKLRMNRKLLEKEERARRRHEQQIAVQNHTKVMMEQMERRREALLGMQQETQMPPAPGSGGHPSWFQHQIAAGTLLDKPGGPGGQMLNGPTVQMQSSMDLLPPPDYEPTPQPAMQPAPPPVKPDPVEQPAVPQQQAPVIQLVLPSAPPATQPAQQPAPPPVYLQCVPPPPVYSQPAFTYPPQTIYTPPAMPYAQMPYHPVTYIPTPPANPVQYTYAPAVPQHPGYPAAAQPVTSMPSQSQAAYAPAPPVPPHPVYESAPAQTTPMNPVQMNHTAPTPPAPQQPEQPQTQQQGTQQTQQHPMPGAWNPSFDARAPTTTSGTTFFTAQTSVPNQPPAQNSTVPPPNAVPAGRLAGNIPPITSIADLNDPRLYMYDVEVPHRPAPQPRVQPQPQPQPQQQPQVQSQPLRNPYVRQTMPQRQYIPQPQSQQWTQSARAQPQPHQRAQPRVQPQRPGENTQWARAPGMPAGYSTVNTGYVKTGKEKGYYYYPAGVGRGAAR